MLILNEQKYAEDLYNGNNDSVKSIVSKIGYITRYHLYVLQLSDADNYRFTVSWMCANHDNFDESYYSNLISDAIKRAHKLPFYDVGSIKITQKELDLIASLNNLRAEKMLFVLLCMAKQQSVAYGFDGGLVKYSISDICKLARVSVPADDREYILHDIVQSGLLRCPKKNDTKCLIVTFIDNGDAALSLDDVDCNELAYVYLSWKNNGKGYTRCKMCNVIMRQSKTKPRKYCEDCAKEVGREQKRLWAEKSRKNLTRQNE